MRVFHSAACLNGHEFDDEDLLDIEAFERHSCPHYVNGKRCGASLSIQYLKIKLIPRQPSQNEEK